jgi:DNA-binding winged helix-turn-helix (wHTH) protein/TolB-like protein/Flp pilus assembly protein TadD
MSQSTATVDSAEPIDLAREADFALGDARVRPSIAEVSVAAERIRLQPRVMQVLVALARAQGEVVSRDDLIASCWGGLAIGDDAINRCIGRLRRLAESEAPGAFAIETLPRIGYRLSLADGVKGTAPRRRMARWWVGLATAAATAAAIGLWLALGTPGWPAGDEGVAVMPFEAPPGDAFARDFATGVDDEIASTLSKADVKSLPSGVGGSADQRDAAALSLGAAFALSGRVQSAGPNLNVDVAVDDARRHAIVWSDRFSYPLSQAQSLQQEVAVKTAAVLHCTLDASGFEGGRMDDESLALYLRGCDWLYSDADGAEGPALFRKVVEREPNFAPAWAKFAVVSEVVGQGLPADQAVVALREARAAAERALQLDPRQGVAYAALADMTPANDLWERQGLVQKGLSVAPDNADLNYVGSDLLVRAGRYNDALAYAQRAATLDPLQFDFVTNLATSLAVVGRLGEARSVIDRAVLIWPDNTDVLEARIMFEARWGDPDRALALLNDPKSRPPAMEDSQVEDCRQFALVRKDRDPNVTAAYVRGVLDQVAAGKMDPSRALIRLNSAGATDAAFTVAMRANVGDLNTDGLFRSSPDGKAMWRDPRFLPLAKRLGLVDFWRRSGRWPDFCEAADRPYDCPAAAAKLGL